MNIYIYIEISLLLIIMMMMMYISTQVRNQWNANMKHMGREITCSKAKEMILLVYQILYTHCISHRIHV